MTWALEEITYPISCNLCAQEFGDLQTFYAHVRLTHLPFPSPTIRESRQTQFARQPRRHINTQDLDMSGSQGSIKREGSRGVEEPRRQLRRTVSRTKLGEGGASGPTAVVPKPKGDGKVEQKSLNNIMLKAILKTHQTMRDLSSTVWDTLLIKASSTEADNMQKQTQPFADKERQEERGHT